MTIKHDTQIFVGKNCISCNRVVAYLKKTKTNYIVTDIHETNSNWAKKLFTIPALVVNKKLMAYGEEDIMKYLKKSN